MLACRAGEVGFRHVVGQARLRHSEGAGFLAAVHIPQHEGRDHDERAAADDAAGMGPTKGLPPVSENMIPALTNALIAPWPTAAAKQLPVRTVT